jgi:O-succinylbenzoic acid--CoA ligase
MQFSTHKNFLLNGSSFLKKEELLDYSKSISEPIFTFLSEFLSDATIVKVQTSGSTGNPKMIEIKKEFMINSAKATGGFFDLNENTTALMCLNPEYIAGKMMLVRALVLGWELDIVSPSSNPLKNIEKVYDFSAMVPFQVFNSIDNLHKIKKLIVGGGVVSKDLESKLKSLKTEVFATYGMTETVTHIAIKKINSVSSKSKDYVLLENVRITKDNRNCLVIDAPKVSDSVVVTNDIVNIKSENQFEWLGRVDSIINSGGVKLIPEQIEQKLSGVIFQRFFISSLPDDTLGQKVILVIEGEEKKVDFSSVANLSKYETPKEIFYLSKFIETETKKTQRKKTLELLF